MKSVQKVSRNLIHTSQLRDARVLTTKWLDVRINTALQPLCRPHSGGLCGGEHAHILTGWGEVHNAM
jgi:hypothetical protein